jgi:hypothetical protein
VELIIKHGAIKAQNMINRRRKSKKAPLVTSPPSPLSTNGEGEIVGEPRRSEATSAPAHAEESEEEK